MKVLLVGGKFESDINEAKSSGIIRKMGDCINEPYELTSINGGNINILDNIEYEKYNLIIWMPDIDNKSIKNYPKKGFKSVMVISKVERTNQSRFDAISRIFTIGANAVILISHDFKNWSFEREKTYTFELIDALGNTWYKGTDINALISNIFYIYNTTINSVRVSIPKNTDLERLVSLTSIVADKFEICTSRFFGNCSTRCGKMFPSSRYFFSKRNTDKRRLTMNDMIYVDENGYMGDGKPSIDAPVQMNIYSSNPQINFMIHGHSYIECDSRILQQPVIMTNEYYFCGDLKEAECVNNIIGSTTHGVINLLNHGFLIYANNIENLEKIVLSCALKNRFEEE